MILYYRHAASLAHDTGPHPENAGRIAAIEGALEREGWAGLSLCDSPAADESWLARVHTPEHIVGIRELCETGGGMIDADTVASPGSWEAALRAAGAACEAAERLLAGEAPAAFCGARPPGHHAERARAMGFCLFNNIAAAAAHALRSGGAERVLVVDWDVHHGNGTEQIFKETDEVLYVSIHQSPLYPGTGLADYRGEGAGEGYTINLPVAPGADERVFAALLEHVVRPVALAYEPDLIALSAGFDAHRADPLASCRLASSSYERLASGLAAVAAELEAPVLACLEGGYDHTALGESVPALLRGLASPRRIEDAERGPAEPHRENLHSRWRGG